MRRFKVITPFFFFFVLFSVFINHQESTCAGLPDAARFQLDNGVTVVVQENHASPVVAFQVWVKAGSVYETDAQAGITHFIEHMVFKGTEKYGPGEIARRIESIGGEINAYTSFDCTVYHLVIGSKFLKTGVDILSDAVFHSSFDPVEIEREKKVVLEEIRMRKDRPSTKLFEKVMAKAYRVSPYKRPVIGSPETVNDISRDSILAYINANYTPSNIVIAVVGDVKTADCLSFIKTVFYGGKNVETKPIISEAPQDEVRTVLITDEINESHLALCFPIPGFTDPDIPAIDVLAAILGNGESSRLYKRVRGERTLAHDISASAFTPRGSGLFEISATLAGEDSEEVLRTALSELYRLKYERVRPEELARAKLNIEADFIYSQGKVEGQARKLGYYEVMAGDFREQANYLKKVAAVSSEDIRQVAEKYFQPNRLTFGLLIPPKTPMSLSEAKIVSLSHSIDKEIKETLASHHEALPGPQKFKLSNGMTLLIKEDPNLPIVSISAVFLGGLRAETDSLNGSFNAMAKLWKKGTKERSYQAIAAAIEDMAGSIDGFSGKNTFGLSGTFISRFFPRGLDILGEILLSPALRKEELEKLRPVLLAKLKEQEDSLPAVTFLNLNKTLFSGHPYAMNPLGNAESVKALSVEGIREIYERYVVPENLVLAIVGNVDAAEAKEQVEKIFSGWKGAKFTKIDPPSPKPIPRPKRVSIQKPKHQVHIAIGFPGVSIYHSDRPALDVLNTILSGQGGRLFRELRDKQSLAYSLSAFSTEGLETGAFGVYMATRPEMQALAIENLWAELDRVCNEEISGIELDRAKKYITGTTQIGLQTYASQAMDMSLNERYQLGYEFTKKYLDQIDKVSPNDILRAARTYIQKEKHVLITVGPLNSNESEQKH